MFCKDRVSVGNLRPIKGGNAFNMSNCGYEMSFDSFFIESGIVLGCVERAVSQELANRGERHALVNQLGGQGMV